MLCTHLVFAVVVLTAHSVFSGTFEDAQATCREEIGYVGDILKINYNDPSVPKEAKCFVACTLEKLDVLKEDGSIDRAKEKKVVEEAVKDEDLKKKFLKAIDECDTAAKANMCETAFEFIKCKRTKAGVN